MTQYPPGVPYQSAPQPPPSTSGVAIASLVMGIPGLCIPLLGIGAIVCGAIGLSQTKDNRVGGRGLAIAGLILGIVGVFISLMSIGILLPSLNRAREIANRVKCAQNMRQIGQGLLVYANENRNQFPPNLDVLFKTQSLSSTLLNCPSSSAAGSSYIYVVRY